MTSPNSTTKPSWVYIVSSGYEGPIKIGMTSRSIEDRLNALQTGGAIKLELWGFIICAGRHEARNIELELHQRCSKLRMNGEWFRSRCIKKLLGDNRIMWVDHPYVNLTRNPSSDLSDFSQPFVCFKFHRLLRYANRKTIKMRIGISNPTNSKIIDAEAMGAEPENYFEMRRIFSFLPISVVIRRLIVIDGSIVITWNTCDGGYFIIKINDGVAKYTMNIHETKEADILLNDDSARSYIFAAYTKSRFVDKQTKKAARKEERKRLSVINSR